MKLIPFKLLPMIFQLDTVANSSNKATDTENQRKEGYIFQTIRFNRLWHFVGRMGSLKGRRVGD